jgi:heme-degrading monooxygenase HmoA
MFARITHYKMKPGSRDAATKVLESLRDQILGMPGMHQFLNVMNADGNGYVVSVVESEESSDANAAKVAAPWSSFSQFLEGPPKADGFDVISNWSN